MTDTPPDPQPEPEPQPDPEPVRDPDQVLADNRRIGRENAAIRKELKDAQAKLDEITKANMNEVERAIADAELRGEEKGRASLMPQLRNLRLGQVAVGLMAEPELAGELLASAELDLDDHDAIVKAIEGLVERHPSLGIAPTAQRPAFDQGPRGNGETAPKTMNDQLLDVLGIQKQR
jgi:hypothetical protein